MGAQFFDQYTYLHFASGIIAYFWGIGIWTWMIGHAIFEWLENTTVGMRMINTALGGIWPGGKHKSDSLQNIIGDNIGTALGWFSALALDRLGASKGWYNMHISN